MLFAWRSLNADIGEKVLPEPGIQKQKKKLSGVQPEKDNEEDDMQLVVEI